MATCQRCENVKTSVSFPKMMEKQKHHQITRDLHGLTILSYCFFLGWLYIYVSMELLNWWSVVKISKSFYGTLQSSMECSEDLPAIFPGWTWLNLLIISNLSINGLYLY
jgi:hypothetical protein